MGKNFVITLLSMLLAIAVAVITVTTWKNNQEQNQEQTVQNEDHPAPSITIDERIDNWKIEKDWDKSYDIYINMPEEVLRKVLVKVGAEADVPEIAYEYLSNINYYITSLVKDKIHLNKDSIPGVDSLKIQLEALKVNKEENIPVTASDEDK